MEKVPRKSWWFMEKVPRKSCDFERKSSDLHCIWPFFSKRFSFI